MRTGLLEAPSRTAAAAEALLLLLLVVALLGLCMPSGNRWPPGAAEKLLGPAPAPAVLPSAAAPGLLLLLLLKKLAAPAARAAPDSVTVLLPAARLLLAVALAPPLCLAGEAERMCWAAAAGALECAVPGAAVVVTAAALVIALADCEAATLLLLCNVLPSVVVRDCGLFCRAKHAAGVAGSCLRAPQGSAVAVGSPVQPAKSG